MLEDRLRAPDGNAGLTMNDLKSQHQIMIHRRGEDLDLNNPLSLHDEVHEEIISFTWSYPQSLIRILGMNGLLVLSCGRLFPRT